MIVDTILAKIFGTKTAREVKSMLPTVAAINELEPAIRLLSDIDLAAGTMFVHGSLSRVGIVGPPKSRRGRRMVALPRFAIAALRRELKRRPGATGPMLTGPAPGGRITIQRTGEWWRDLRTRAGIGSDVRFHDLRGTAATLALSAGVTPTEVARSLGHDPAVLMRTYAGAIPGGRELVAYAIARALVGES